MNSEVILLITRGLKFQGYLANLSQALVRMAAQKAVEECSKSVDDYMEKLRAATTNYMSRYSAWLEAEPKIASYPATTVKASNTQLMDLDAWSNCKKDCAQKTGYTVSGAGRKWVPSGFLGLKGHYECECALDQDWFDNQRISWAAEEPVDTAPSLKTTVCLQCRQRAANEITGNDAGSFVNVVQQNLHSCVFDLQNATANAPVVTTAVTISNTSQPPESSTTQSQGSAANTTPPNATASPASGFWPPWVIQLQKPFWIVIALTVLCLCCLLLFVFVL